MPPKRIRSAAAAPSARIGSASASKAGKGTANATVASAKKSSRLRVKDNNRLAVQGPAADADTGKGKHPVRAKAPTVNAASKKAAGVGPQAGKASSMTKQRPATLQPPAPAERGTRSSSRLAASRSTSGNTVNTELSAERLPQSTPPQIRWQRDEAAEPTAPADGLGSTPPPVRWQREGREGSIGGETLPVEEGEDAEIALGSSDKENAEPSTSAHAISTTRTRAEMRQTASDFVAATLGTRKHAPPQLLTDGPQHPPTSRGGPPAHSTPQIGRIPAAYRQVKHPGARAPLRTIDVASRLSDGEDELEAEAEAAGLSAADAKPTLDELMGLHERARGTRKGRTADGHDDEGAAAEFRPPQDPIRLQSWVTAQASARGADRARMRVYSDANDGSHMQAASPSSSALLQNQSELGLAGAGGDAYANGITQSEDALEKDAQDMSSAMLGYQPSWMREPVGDELDEEYERQKRLARRNAKEREAEDDEFGILQEVRQTARMIRRRGLYGSPGSRAQQQQQVKEEGADRRGERQFGTPSRKANGSAPSSDVLSSLLSSPPAPASPTRRTRNRGKAVARQDKDSSSSGPADRSSSSVAGAEDLVNMLPNRSVARPLQKTVIGAKQATAAKARAKASTGRSAQTKSTRRSTTRKAAMSDSTSSDDENEADAEEGRLTKKQRLSSPTLGSDAAKEREQRLNLYASLEDYKLPEELVL